MHKVFFPLLYYVICNVIKIVQIPLLVFLACLIPIPLLVFLACQIILGKLSIVLPYAAAWGLSSQLLLLLQWNFSLGDTILSTDICNSGNYYLWLRTISVELVIQWRLITCLNIFLITCSYEELRLLKVFPIPKEVQNWSFFLLE